MCILPALPYSFFMDRYADAYVGIVRAFVETLSGKAVSPNLAGAVDGKATILAGMAAQLSVKEKRPVKISEIVAKRWVSKPHRG